MMKTARPLPSWQSLTAAPFDEACAVLASAGAWEELGAPKVFLVAFSRKEAWEARQQAMLGLVGRNHMREQFIVDTIETLREIYGSEEEPLRMHADTCRRFLAEFMTRAKPDDLRRLAKHMEGGNDLGKGGPESPRGEMWAAFCLFAINHHRLPSRDELRSQVNFKRGSNSADKHFADYLKELGLSALENPPEK